MIVGCAAAVALLAGATCLYVSTPHQALLAAQKRRPAWRRVGAALLTVSVLLLLTIQGPATAIFTAVSGAMLVWSIVPVVAGWWRFRAGTMR